ncbi:MAG: histidine--tRNA ligase [Actinobacteria bacterium]|nr:histidine--tRNA ligase [Actinomycetota bacterium]
MSDSPQAPRGTYDVLPVQSAERSLLIEIAEEEFELAGYARIDTPIFEETTVFARGVGESTEIVSKEMYSFTDQGDRSLTLRPEGTAAIARAYGEHGMHKLPAPVKLWYYGPFFRQEAPQAGRYRQFFQIGAEALGSDDPALDAESIALLDRILRRAGVEGYRLRVSSLGSAPERRAYSEQLKGYLRDHDAELSDEVRERIELNPLRAFDSKHPGTIEVMKGAPKLLDTISAGDRAHFDEVLALLDAAGVGYEVDPSLVRGLDYYTRTVFEFTSDRLGAQSGVGGGGRYDGLVEMLGGPATPGVGWAAGVERIVQAGEIEGARTPGELDVFVALETGADRAAAFALASKLQESGVAAVIELAGRSLKGQLKQASRAGALRVVIMGGERGQYDAAIKNMDGGQQHELSGLTADDYLERIIESLTEDMEAATAESAQ